MLQQTLYMSLLASAAPNKPLICLCLQVLLKGTVDRMTLHHPRVYLTRVNLELAGVGRKVR